MKVKFRQTTRNGCFSLSIANIFDDHRFTLDLEGSRGESFAEINRKLDGLACGIYVDCVFLTSQYFKAGNRLKAGQSEIFRYPRMTKKMRNEVVVPYLFSIANGPGRNQHMIAVIHNLSDNMFHVVDSTKENVIALTLPELLKKYHILCVAMFRIWDNPEPANYVTIHKSEMGHIFDLHL